MPFEPVTRDFLRRQKRRDGRRDLAHLNRFARCGFCFDYRRLDIATRYLRRPRFLHHYLSSLRNFPCIRPFQVIGQNPRNDSRHFIAGYRRVAVENAAFVAFQKSEARQMLHSAVRPVASRNIFQRQHAVVLKIVDFL